MKDYSTYRFRASGLSKILTPSRSKSDPLSETAKSYLRELWIKEEFGRDKFVVTKYMTKGIAVESDSLDLVEKVTGETFFKNKERLSNDYITGTPDVIDKEFILDIKSSWDIYTYASVNYDKAYKDYYAQMLAYMWLTGRHKARIAYCLVNTPEAQIEKELYTLTINGIISESIEDQDKARKSYLFDDIPAEKRVKIYEFSFNELVKEQIIEKINLSRGYMNLIRL